MTGTAMAAVVSASLMPWEDPAESAPASSDVEVGVAVKSEVVVGVADSEGRLVKEAESILEAVGSTPTPSAVEESGGAVDDADSSVLEVVVGDHCPSFTVDELASLPAATRSAGPSCPP